MDGSVVFARWRHCVPHLIFTAQLHTVRRVAAQHRDRNVTTDYCDVTSPYVLSGWQRGVVASVVRRMNEVTLRRARLVLGWVTVFGRVYHHGM